MLIKFVKPDPRAGSIARMDSQRGQQLVDSGAAVPMKEDGTELKTEETVVTEGSTEGYAVEKTGGKPSDGLKVDALKAALDAKGIEIPEGAKKADLAALLDGAE